MSIGVPSDTAKVETFISATCLSETSKLPLVFCCCLFDGLISTDLPSTIFQTTNGPRSRYHLISCIPRQFSHLSTPRIFSSKDKYVCADYSNPFETIQNRRIYVFLQHSHVSHQELQLFVVVILDMLILKTTGCSFQTNHMRRTDAHAVI